jgi:hypothetical protein
MNLAFILTLEEEINNLQESSSENFNSLLSKLQNVSEQLGDVPLDSFRQLSLE